MLNNLIKGDGHHDRPHHHHGVDHEDDAHSAGHIWDEHKYIFSNRTKRDLDQHLEDHHAEGANHAVASIVVYFEHIMPKDQPVYKEWYEQWLAIKIAEHSKQGSLNFKYQL